MAGKNTSAFGIYRNEASLRNGVEALEQEGFRTTDMSVLFPANEGTKDFAHEKGTKAPEGAVAGASTGALVVGLQAWGRSSFPASVLSWPLGRLSQCSPVWV